MGWLNGLFVYGGWLGESKVACSVKSKDEVKINEHQMSG